MRPTQIAMDRYVLGDAITGGVVSGPFVPKEGSYGREDGPGRVHARNGVWCEEHQSKYSNNRKLRNLVEVVEEEVEDGKT